MEKLARDNRQEHIAILLDDRPLEVKRGTTLSDLVGQLGHNPTEVATAVNGVFFPKALRHRELETGDHVLCFQAIVGG